MPQTWPVRIRQIHQIEITTFCNLRCTWCPSPNLPDLRRQERRYMEMATFRAAMAWCRHFWCEGTQGELSLTGIGESLLHPDFPEMVRLARATLPGCFLNLSTNGLEMTDDIAVVLARYEFGVFVSDHVPERARKARVIAERHGVFLALNPSARTRTNSINWAGQVDHPVTYPPGHPCPWLGLAWGAVLVDGRISSCCFDASGEGVIGDVADIPGSAFTRPFGLCPTCHHVVP